MKRKQKAINQSQRIKRRDRADGDTPADEISERMEIEAARGIVDIDDVPAIVPGRRGVRRGQ